MTLKEISDLPPECQFGPEGVPSTDTKKVRIAKNLSKEELTKPLGTGGINTAIRRGQEKNHAQFWTMYKIMLVNNTKINANEAVKEIILRIFQLGPRYLK